MADVSIGLLLTGAATLGAPLILAAMGGLTSERGGVMNIALEGKMLAAACLTALVGASTRNAALGLAAGLSAAILLSLLHLLLTQTYRIDHIVSGMAINFLAIGGTSFLFRRFVDPDASGEIPQLPLIAYYALSLAVPLILAWLLARSAPGLRLIAVGNDPEKSRQMGVDPIAVRRTALLATGLLTGLSGALIVTNAGRFTENMTSGRGFIALAALILGGWRPIPATLACLVFGLFEALQLQLQGSTLFGANIPSQAWNALPYIVTLIALAGFLGKSRPPAGLGKA